IDSIKRVEILGAVQDQLPGLPELNPEDLAELRTLGQIVDYMQSRLPQAGVAAGSAPAAVSAASPGIDAGRFADTLMQVVAEKTGYPVEMLELDMDMEADLGIDSIKRVEILGAAQDAMPGLPEVSPETLAEMRTLREIVSAFVGVAGTAATTGAAVVEHAPSATVAIRRLNAPALIEASASGNCLLVDDGSQEAVTLAGKLQAQGWTVAVMVPGWVNSGRKKNFAKTVRQLPVSSPDDDAVAQAVAACQPLDAVIYMHGAGKLDGIAYPQDSRQGLLLAFLLAKHCQLKQSSHARASFVAVTRQGGRFGFDSADADLVQGGVSGLVKTLAQEWPSVFCRTVDLHDKLAGAKAADILFDELFAADRQLAEIGYDGEGRLTLVPELTDSYALAAGDSVDDSSVFLVSGGARGVTAHCVIRLAQEKHSRFILLGRSPLADAEPAWASGISDADALKKAAMQALIAAGDKPTPVKVQQFMNPLLAQREIRSTLAAIEAAGGKALYVSADV
ncbi:MAG TPA: phosphopantetheine-binding protein, partial [Pseudomonadales bacterium]